MPEEDGQERLYLHNDSHDMSVRLTLEAQDSFCGASLLVGHYLAHK